MLNTESFLDRLQNLMDNNQLNATAFAQKIGVQRSSVSHILSKRNKPSLEFMLKVHEHFDEVNLDWLILGNKKSSPPPLSAVVPKELTSDLFKVKSKKEVLSEKHPKNEDLETEEVFQIIQLYKNGSFRSYIPKS
ncbi:helix-turn-helix domain-containing protein [Flavobacteriaceae bacterium]|nr:helix-turn-helix domain-containing protein [Flavobacteriaceae bacterium]